MLSKTLISSDLFLDMPLSSQALYMHFTILADDDGFVNNPRRIQRMIGASEDDFKILLAKRFIISFESGIIVITHWKINNYIQKDRYKETVYQYEKSLLQLGDNNIYSLETTQCIQNGYKMDTQVSIGKDRLVKDSIDKGREKEPPPTNQYGEYQNINLTQEQYKTLQEKLGTNTDTMINKLSRYIKSSGKTYKDHYVTILNWYEQDKEKLAQKKGTKTYSDNYEDSNSI